MIHDEGFFASTDGSKLYFQCWKPEMDCKAIIAIAHGSGEHSGRYGNMVNYFLEKNYALYGFDFRGHGKSAGQTGHVMSWQEYREDLDCFLQWVRTENPDKPLFLYSHSMGAQIALDYLTLNAKQPLAAVIASSPALAQPGVSPMLMRLGKLLSAIWPRFTLQNGLDVKAISRDPEVVRAYSEDPLVSSKISARFGTEFMACIDRVQSNADKLEVPLFIFHGEADQIIPVAGSRRFFDKVSFADKQLKIYPDGFHEPHNDLQQQEVFQDVEQWLNRHMMTKN